MQESEHWHGIVHYSYTRKTTDRRTKIEPDVKGCQMIIVYKSGSDIETSDALRGGEWARVSLSVVDYEVWEASYFPQKA